MIVQEPVQAAIWHCLNHYDYLNAVFLSERLYAEAKSDESLYLLATAYYRSSRTSQAYYILKDRYGCSTQCQLLFAICAFDLEKYAEAEWALLEAEDGSMRSLDEVVTEFGDQACFVLLLLGKIGLKTERKPRAIEAWKRALKINPFLYSAFELLCKLGERPDPNAIFQTENIENMSMCQGHSINRIECIIIPNNTSQSSQISDKMEKMDSYTTPTQIMITYNPSAKIKQKDMCTPDESPLAHPLTFSDIVPLPSTKMKAFRVRSDFIQNESPSFGQFFDSPTVEYSGTPNFNQPTLQQSLAKRMRAHVDQLVSRHSKEGILQNSKPVLSQSSNVPTVNTPTTNLTIPPNQIVRRSSRLFGSYSVKENNKSPESNQFVTPKSPSKRSKARLAKNKSVNCNEMNNLNKNLLQEKTETVTSDKNTLNQSNGNENCIQQAIQMQKQSTDGLMALLRVIGQAHVALNSYDCQTVLQTLQTLSSNQFNTSWIYCLMGSAYFEMNDYEMSIKYFQMVHSQDPYHLDYMDIYSTALWHLQKEVALSALAQDLINTNKNHPVTWCVNGNCFSLHKEHDTAIKFFQRAVQVDPNFYYAYTLLGHEYITTEELDKAMSCFWNAVRINPRHYNAWFGIGTIYSKQERYKLAELNYTKALSINMKSSVILCHIGIVQHALKQTDKALATFNRALANNPNSPLCKFHRGSVYFAVGRHSEALKELEELKEIVPKESSVYYLIGKVHKKLGNTDLALQHFSWATDLDPKGASSQIKEAFDPAIGRNSNEIAESPQSPIPDEYQSESNSGNQGDGMNFDGLPDDSGDSSVFEIV
ncbi:hypothetical protein ABEB36_001192 [Hypothenemus hampei]|uniref:Cell division cycle protein 27 homolog n=1 Tax=Hypothenemus hampei TaxID=57062 RepID=A0ABD1FEE5_HYPHA